MRHSILKTFLFFAVIFLSLIAIGCRDILTKHNIDLNGVKHGKKLYKGAKLKEGAKNCTACHGVELDGNAFIPSCYSCHGTLWSNDDHRTKFGGVNHYMAVSSFSSCSQCHGADLMGKRSRPSCYKCHDNNWINYPFHTKYKDGYAHAPGLKTPMTSCVRCHGATLRGGSAQSCYNCHGNVWDGN